MSLRGYQTGCLFSPVPPKSHIEPLLYRDDGTGAKGKPKLRIPFIAMIDLSFRLSWLVIQVIIAMFLILVHCSFQLIPHINRQPIPVRI